MKNLLFIAFALGLASCSSAENEDLISAPQESTEVSNDHRVTQAEAIKLAASFRSSSETLSRSEDSDASDVENVVVVRWEDLYPDVPNPVINGDGTVSRGDIGGTPLEPITVDTLFYIVNEKNNAGYTVVAAFDRIAPIYAVVEQGNFKMEDGFTENIRFSYDAVDLLLMSLDIRLVEHIEEVVDKSNIFLGISVRPMLKTCWGSGLKNTGPGNYHSLAVSVAQMQSYYKTSPVNYSKGLNWDSIIDDCNNNNGKPSNPLNVTQMTDLLTCIDGSLDSKEWRDNLYGYEYDIKEWMDTQNLNVDNFKAYDKNKIAKSLEDYKLVFMFGKQNLKKNDIIFETITHAWVVDGCDFKAYEKEDGTISYPRYLHCNWGRGGEANGYYVGELFDTANQYYPDDKLSQLGYGFSHTDVRYATVNPK